MFSLLLLPWRYAAIDVRAALPPFDAAFAFATPLVYFFLLLMPFICYAYAYIYLFILRVPMLTPCYAADYAT